MNNEKLNNIRNALNDMFDKLDITLYKDAGKKSGLAEINPSRLVVENFQYIVKLLEELDQT